MMLWSMIAMGAEPADGSLFADALSFEVERVDAEVHLHVHVAPGWKVFGRGARYAQPLVVTIDGHAMSARVPRQRQLTGTVELVVRTPEDAGSLRFQVCSDVLCSPALESKWTLKP